MKNSNEETKTLREKYCNRKGILILVGVIVLLGAVCAGGLLKASEKPSFCNTCHIMEPYYQSWNSGVLLASKHADAGVECQDCHHSTIPDKALQGLNYITGNYKMPLHAPEVDRAYCLDCHSEEGGASSWEEIESATDFEESNPHDSHNGEQNCTLCHKMHAESKPMCVECHIFDWFDDLGDGWSTEWEPEDE
jgi:cytochrome c nitrite reductase small subunit